MDIVEFWTICSANGIVLDKEQVRQIERYRDELVYWNEKVNLISRKDIDNVLENHVLHSLSCLKYISLPPGAKCLDLGTGGGLPGIPIAIAQPEINMFLVDSIGKKTKIAGMLASHTGLRRIKSVTARVEELANKKEYRTFFDFVFARAVTGSVRIVQWVEKLVKPGAKIVLFKGGDLTAEITDLKKIYSKINVVEQKISFLGYAHFEKEEKKLLICSL